MNSTTLSNTAGLAFVTTGFAWLLHTYRKNGTIGIVFALHQCGEMGSAMLLPALIFVLEFDRLVAELASNPLEFILACAILLIGAAVWFVVDFGLLLSGYYNRDR